MKILWIISLILLSACSENRLEQSLRLAGENRKELEKVLHHYSLRSEDSLKLRAARFLIENMPGHFTREGKIMDSCRQQPIYFYSKKILDISAGVYLSEVTEKTEDIAVIKADYLIRHIDASFELMKYPWVKALPFEWFLDYILPYRLEYEQLNAWRDSFSLAPSSIIHQQQLHNDKFDASEVDLSLTNALHYPLSKIYQKFLGKDLTAECHYIYLRDEFYNRAKGLPAVLDFIPCYPNRNGHHYWSTVLSPIRKKSQITGAPESLSAKVYRRTYSHNFTLSPGQGEYIPPFFQDPFNKDVTEEYFHTADIMLTTGRKGMPSNLRYGYLAVFNNLQWIPIAIGKRTRNKVTFHHMGKNLLYLPVFFQQEDMQPMDYPFALKANGSIQKYIPDTLHKIDLHLYRKYPYTSRVDFSQWLSSVIVEGSDQPTFSTKDTITPLKFRYDRYHFDETIKMEKPYRYLRISCLSSHLLAEVYFWDEKSRELSPTTDSLTAECLDRNPLTTIKIKEQYITFDFGKPVKLSRAVCLPRSDGNGIYPGSLYELFYYDQGDWKSLGMKEATDFHLDYSGVPSEAIYWLRNLTGGVEERIFSYENQECRFW